MAKFMNTNRKPFTTMAVLAVVTLMIILLLASSWNFLISTFLSLWSLSKRRPIIHIILNFIIISLLTSSSFCFYFNILLHKLQPKPKPPHVERTKSHVIPFLGEDDTWWVRVIEDDHVKLDATWQSEEQLDVVDDHEHEINNHDQELETLVVEKKLEEVADDQEEDDTLDATWMAIMEAKKKGGGPQLKKSCTWSSGDRDAGGGEGDSSNSSGDGLATKARAMPMRMASYKRELKKWPTFAEHSEKGGGGGGWRKKEMVLTYHDELKKKADDFIAKFVNSMRLQRLESDQRFLEMINRGH